MNLDANPMKILFYKDRLEQITENIIPLPVMLEIDPCDFCNFSCSWCSSKYALDRKQMVQISPERFKHIVKFIKFCDGFHNPIYGIYWCGGGEPTLNPNLLDFMKETKELGLRNYITTNGSTLSSVDIEKLLYSNDWIGISVVASNRKTWLESGGGKINFEKYVDGLRKINEINNKRVKPIEVNFKFVYDDKSYQEIVGAYLLARELGFRKITIKPVDLFIYDRGVTDFEKIWNKDIIGTINLESNYIRNLAKHDGVVLDYNDFYGTFDCDKDKRNYHTCWTSMLAPVFGADGTIHVCCVRRGEKSVGRWDDGNLASYWNSDEHRNKLFGFDPIGECPIRCKFHKYNEIFQQIFKDENFSIGSI